MLNFQLLFETSAMSFLGAVIPGPSFMVVFLTTLQYGKKYGIMSCFGAIFALSLWILLAIVGIGIVFTKYPSIKLIFDISAIFFFIYMAYSVLKVKNIKMDNSDVKIANGNSFSFFIKGFLGTGLDVLPCVWYSALFGVIVNEYNGSLLLASVHGIVFMILNSLWYIVAGVLCVSMMKKFAERHLNKIAIVSCILMVYFALKMLYDIIK